MYLLLITIRQADWTSLTEIDEKLINFKFNSNLESTKPYYKIEQAIENYKIIKKFGEI